MNSSASITLDQSDLHTITTVAADRGFDRDRLWLNGKEVEINGRGVACLREIRKLAQDRVDPSTGEVIVRKEDWPSYHVRISSVNTFPTGAGLASSAAGLACFVSSLAALYCVKEEYPGQLTAIARQGSGSASRSMFGGYVKWLKGSGREDASDSIAVQIADENHWPELRALILVVSDKEKDTSSTSGMETSRLTSPLLQYRASTVVEPRLMEQEQAFLNKDFETFGRLTIQDSNQFHAVCLDTYPPIFYMNDVSKHIIRLCSVINSYFGGVRAAYTFDAGPNAVVYTLDEYVPMLLSIFAHHFPAPSAVEDYCNVPEQFTQLSGERERSSESGLVSAELWDQLDRTGHIPLAGEVKYIFSTRSGPGPLKQGPEEHLLSAETGLPVPPSPRHKRLIINTI